MTSLSTARKSIERLLAQRFIDGGLRQVNVRRDQDCYRAFVKSGELSFGLVPMFSLRHKLVQVDASICIIDAQFEAENQCELFNDCCFQTFSAHSANFDAFRSIGWLSGAYAPIELDRIAAAYLRLAQVYPATRSALLVALEEGHFSGVPLAPFQRSMPKTRVFLEWLRQEQDKDRR